MQQQEYQQEPLEDVDQTAKRLNVPKSWVYANAAKIGGIKLGKYVRFRPSQTDRLLDERAAKA